MLSQNELMTLVIIACFYAVMITWMFIKKMKLFGIIISVIEIFVLLFINSQIQLNKEESFKNSKVEQTITIQSYYTLENGNKVCIDTFSEDITIPIKQFKKIKK